MLRHYTDVGDAGLQSSTLKTPTSALLLVLVNVFNMMWKTNEGNNTYCTSEVAS